MTEGAFRLFTERLGLQESAGESRFKKPDELVAAKMRASRWLSDVLRTVWEGLTSSPGYEEHILGAIKRNELDSKRTPKPETIGELRQAWTGIKNRIEDFDRFYAEGNLRVVNIVFDPVLVPELDDYIALAAEEDERVNEDLPFKLVFHLWTEKDYGTSAMIDPDDGELHLFLDHVLPLGPQGLRELMSSANHELHHLARSGSGAHAEKTPCGEAIGRLRTLSKAQLKSLPGTVGLVANYLSTEAEISAHAMEAAMWVSEHGGDIRPNASVRELVETMSETAKYEKQEHGRVPSTIEWSLEFLTLAYPSRMEKEYRSKMTAKGARLLKGLGLSDEDVIECCSKVADAYAARLSSYFQAVERNKG